MEFIWLVVIALIIAAPLLALRYLRRGRRQARAAYQQLLQQSLADGVLSPDELAQLDAVRQEGALTAEEVRLAALAIYRSALRDAAADARLTSEEDATLRRLQEQLGLTEADLGSDFAQLSRLRMLARIAEGNMPEVTSPVALVPDEHCHWVVQCTLAERMSLPQTGRRPLNGHSFNVLTAEPFAVAGPRDALRPAESILPSDVGVLVVTSRRTIFQGARRTASVPHARVESITLFQDGLRVEEIGQARRYFIVEDAELICAILLQAARTRRAEIRPARPDRSA